MFYTSSLRSRFVCIFLVSCLTGYTRANSVSGESHDLEFKNHEEPDTIYDEIFEVNSKQSTDFCYSDLCKNGGNCIDGLFEGYFCECKEPYWGYTCQNSPCTQNPCANGGTCKVEGTSFKCTCKEPYSGIKCETSPCTQNPCANGGTCKVEGTSFKCTCKEPYSGTKCETSDACDDRGNDICRSVFKKCVKRVDNQYECGDCLNGYIKDANGMCSFASCENIGSYMCSRTLRKCVDQLDIGYKCGDCLNDSFTEDFDTNTCILVTCENVGGYRCSLLNRNCEGSHNGYQCGKCKKGFVEFEGRKECVKECSCENAECKYNDKMEPYCDCYRGFGLWTSRVCKACNCGKGVGCYFGIRNRVLNKYCECPDGSEVIDGTCKVTCKNIGYEYCGEMNRTCSENTTEGYECGDCKEGYVEDTETKKCVIATCANKGNHECGNLGRNCLNGTSSSYECGECSVGFLPVEGSDSCSLDLCLSSPCKNSGICKVVNDSFICFCHHPFFGETCEQEILPTTMLESTTSNYTSSSLPDGVTNSTVDDGYSTTESSNYTSDFNLTSANIETTEATVGFTTSIDSNATTSNPTTLADTTITSERPTKSDYKLKFIFRNVYTVRNLTEVIVKNSEKR